MITSPTGGWTTLQKVTPVIVGLGVLILVGLIWCLGRVYKRRKYARRAQGTYPSHRRNQSTLSYSSTSHLNPADPGRLSLPMHRIPFFFRGMFPARGQKNPDWNIEGESTLSRRSSVAYDSPPHPESGSLLEPAPGIAVEDGTPPVSPAETWSPFRAVSRWWSSITTSKNGDYQTVHLLWARKNSKPGNDDDDILDPEFAAPPQNLQFTSMNDCIPSEAPAVVVVPDDDNELVSRTQTLQLGTESTLTSRPNTASLRPNRPGSIIAVEDPSLSQQVQSVGVSQTVSDDILPSSTHFVDTSHLCLLITVPFTGDSIANIQ